MPFAPKALSALRNAVNDPLDGSESSQAATDNVISALFKICTSASGRIVDDITLWPILLQSLPIVTDTVEALIVYDSLATLLHRSPAVALGRNFEYLGQVIRVIARVANSKLVTPETNLKLAEFLHQVATTTAQTPAGPTQPILMQLWESLSADAKQNIVQLQTLWNTHSQQAQQAQSTQQTSNSS